MIDRTEIEARARKLNLLPHHVAKDYVLNHLLAAIADERAPVVFRGGTALSRAYWPDFRLSEDLDFISEARSSDLEGASKATPAPSAGRHRSEVVIRSPTGGDGPARGRSPRQGRARPSWPSPPAGRGTLS